MFRDGCLVCNSQNLERIIDLGIHPFADTFVAQGYEGESELIYPLQCDLCKGCGNIQTSCSTDPEDRYVLRDYSYTSSNSELSRSHWKKYARDITTYIKLKREDFVVEVGSNDGFLLKALSDDGYNNSLGIDPSDVMASAAKKNYGVETHVGLFEEIVCAPNSPLRHCKLIIANNVFNHSNDPLEFAKGINNALDEDGYFVYELPYWMSALQDKKFDQIYHEHVSYFTATSSYNLLKQANLKIVKIEVVDYHGGSLRVYAQKGTPDINEELKDMMEREIEYGVFDRKIYKEFMDYVFQQRNHFMKKIFDIKLKGSNIIAVGAAAKGNTFLNFYNLDHTLIDYVTDASFYKQGKYTPLTRIPICGDEIFASYDDVYALILSWNISNKLKQILKNINPKIKFLSLEGNNNVE